MGLFPLEDNTTGLPKYSKPTLPEIETKHTEKVWSFRYYPNTNHFYSYNLVFEYVCMYCLFRINMDGV